jgi:hypothetical protein
MSSLVYCPYKHCCRRVTEGLATVHQTAEDISGFQAIAGHIDQSPVLDQTLNQKKRNDLDHETDIYNTWMNWMSNKPEAVHLSYKT